uniref:Uncharacterized protein n=1 Tax=Anguilla anguilla TaxID=7936 RepID=A0A0E9VQC4_ANGAN
MFFKWLWSMVSLRLCIVVKACVHESN